MSLNHLLVLENLRELLKEQEGKLVVTEGVVGSKDLVSIVSRRYSGC